MGRISLTPILFLIFLGLGALRVILDNRNGKKNRSMKDKLYNNANRRAVDTLSPTTVQPVLMTCLLANWRPKSQTKCRTPLKLWKVTGSATPNLIRNLAARGKAPKAAAIEADSRCQPNKGAAT